MNENIHEINKEGKKYWSRICPKCNKDILHKNYDGARKCHAQKRNCRNCSQWNKGLTQNNDARVRAAAHNMLKNNYDELNEVIVDGVRKWERICPKCNNKIIHKSLISARMCYKQKRTCASCGSWTKGQTKETNPIIRAYSQKHSRWLKEFRKTNPPWNIGLTKENNEIVKYIGECRLGIPHTADTRKLIGEYTKKLWDNGHWGGRSSNKWVRYRNKVQYLTRKTILNIPTYDPKKRGRCGVDGAFQIDHIMPIEYGFINNVPAEDVASPSNLQFIPWEENLKKGKNYDGQNKISSTIG
jgi:ribosomal protein L33